MSIKTLTGARVASLASNASSVSWTPRAYRNSAGARPSKTEGRQTSDRPEGGGATRPRPATRVREKRSVSLWGAAARRYCMLGRLTRSSKLERRSLMNTVTTAATIAVLLAWGVGVTALGHDPHAALRVRLGSGGRRPRQRYSARVAIVMMV